MTKKIAYLLIHHSKGIDWASGYGEETVQAVTTDISQAQRWVEGLKENGFERRLYREIELL